MIATLTEHRHIVFPPADQGVAALPPAGQEYHVMISTSGVITLRPKKPHQMSLLEHLRGMEGLEISRRRDPIPKPMEL